jgi:hypothetical protein
MGVTLIADISDSRVIVVLLGLILGVLLGMALFAPRGPR